MLRATSSQTLISLLVSLDRASSSASSAIPVQFDSNDLIILLRFAVHVWHRSAGLRGCIATRAAGHGSGTDASILSDRRVDPVDDLVLTALFRRNVLHVVRLVALSCCLSVSSSVYHLLADMNDIVLRLGWL